MQASVDALGRPLEVVRRFWKVLQRPGKHLEGRGTTSERPCAMFGSPFESLAKRLDVLGSPRKALERDLASDCASECDPTARASVRPLQSQTHACAPGVRLAPGRLLGGGRGAVPAGGLLRRGRLRFAPSAVARRADSLGSFTQLPFRVTSPVGPTKSWLSQSRQASWTCPGMLCVHVDRYDLNGWACSL